MLDGCWCTTANPITILRLFGTGAIARRRDRLRLACSVLLPWPPCAAWPRLRLLLVEGCLACRGRPALVEVRACGGEPAGGLKLAASPRSLPGRGAGLPRCPVRPGIESRSARPRQPASAAPSSTKGEIVPGVVSRYDHIDPRARSSSRTSIVEACGSRRPIATAASMASQLKWSTTILGRTSTRLSW